MRTSLDIIHDSAKSNYQLLPRPDHIGARNDREREDTLTSVSESVGTGLSHKGRDDGTERHPTLGFFALLRMTGVFGDGWIPAGVYPERSVRAGMTKNVDNEGKRAARLRDKFA